MNSTLFKLAKNLLRSFTSRSPSSSVNEPLTSRQTTTVKTHQHLSHYVTKLLVVYCRNASNERKATGKKTIYAKRGNFHLHDSIRVKFVRCLDFEVYWVTSLLISLSCIDVSMFVYSFLYFCTWVYARILSDNAMTQVIAITQRRSFCNVLKNKVQHCCWWRNLKGRESADTNLNIAQLLSIYQWLHLETEPRKDKTWKLKGRKFKPQLYDNPMRGLGNAVLALFGTFLVITEVSSKIVRWTQYSGSQGSVEQITRSNFTLRNLRTDIQVHASRLNCGNGDIKHLNEHKKKSRNWFVLYLRLFKGIYLSWLSDL